MRLRALFAVGFTAAFVARPTAADPPPVAPPPAPPSARADVRAGRPLVVYVVVPLCSNEQINCGTSIAGRPGDLAHNIYWGAVFGARRFLARKGSGWESVEIARRDGVFLERAIFRMRVPGAPWGLAYPVEELVVLQAVHGSEIDKAVDHFWDMATSGGAVAFEDGGQTRSERITVAGYAGHNRLMDDKVLPPLGAGARAPVPAFVLACKSEPYFGGPLSRAGSAPLVTTTTLMAPEGYLIDAIARGLGENGSPADLRRRAVEAYAKWQKLTPGQAGSVFAKW